MQQGRLRRRIESIGTGLCVLLLVLMSALVVIQVFSRYVLNHSFVWAEELVRYLMIWMVMLGAALVQSKNEHIRIDFFPRLAGPRGRPALEAIFRGCTLLFLTVITVKGVEAAYFNRMFESSGLRISMMWPTLAVPVGGLLIGIYTALGLVRDLRRVIFRPRRPFEDMDMSSASAPVEPETARPREE